ncbi:hypothetical protein [Streptosporangium sp. NPDC004631]
MLPLALIVALAAGCSGSSVAAAPTPTPAAPSPSPPSATPADPACSTEQIQNFFSDIDDYASRGAFEDEPKVPLRLADVYRWGFQLGMAEGLADFQVYKAVLAAKDAAESWPEAPAISKSIIRQTIHITAQTLAVRCGVAGRYGFSKTAS